jgi:hypothetical protein
MVERKEEEESKNNCTAVRKNPPSAHPLIIISHSLTFNNISPRLSKFLAGNIRTEFAYGIK